MSKRKSGYKRAKYTHEVDIDIIEYVDKNDTGKRGIKTKLFKDLAKKYDLRLKQIASRYHALKNDAPIREYDNFIKGDEEPYNRAKGEIASSLKGVSFEGGELAVPRTEELPLEFTSSDVEDQVIDARSHKIYEPKAYVEAKEKIQSPHKAWMMKILYLCDDMPDDYKIRIANRLLKQVLKKS